MLERVRLGDIIIMRVTVHVWRRKPKSITIQ